MSCYKEHVFFKIYIRTFERYTVVLKKGFQLFLAVDECIFRIFITDIGTKKIPFIIVHITFVYSFKFQTFVAAVRPQMFYRQKTAPCKQEKSKKQRQEKNFYPVRYLFHSYFLFLFFVRSKLIASRFFIFSPSHSSNRIVIQFVLFIW